MALECSLIVSGSLSPRDLVDRAFPDQAARPDFEISGPVWSADLRERLGFVLRLRQGEQGYFEAESGDEVWTWEPDRYLNLGFAFDKEADRGASRREMLAIVARVLATGGENAALILNGDTVLLRREGGELTRLPAGGFWDTLAPGDIPERLRPER